MSVYAEYRHGMITREEFLSAVREEVAAEQIAEDRAYGYYTEQDEEENYD